MISADKETREKYQIRQDTIREETFALNGARLEGIEIGREEGRQEGREEGRQEGHQKGREEGSHNNSIETAKKMLRHNEPLSKIIDYTNLSEEEIIEIKKEI